MLMPFSRPPGNCSATRGMPELFGLIEAASNSRRSAAGSGDCAPSGRNRTQSAIATASADVRSRRVVMITRSLVSVVQSEIDRHFERRLDRDIVEPGGIELPLTYRFDRGL